jgi:hypothetical protein
MDCPANRIYICNNTAQTSFRFRINTAIHELAHYVSAAKGVFRIGDPLNGFFFDPSDGENLAKPDPTVSAKARETTAGSENPRRRPLCSLVSRGVSRLS